MSRGSSEDSGMAVQHRSRARADGIRRHSAGGYRPGTGSGGVNDALVGLGLASVGSDRVVRWNDKGRAIAAAVRVDRASALLLEAEAMGWDVLDDLEEVGLW
jgi:hypothetical protein